MRKFLIEGSCDGAMFTETVEANSPEDAETFAIERLCEAWGETYGPDTELSDLGDAACVTEYSPDDYMRDAAPDLFEALSEARKRIAENIGDFGGILGKIEAALAKARGETRS